MLVPDIDSCLEDFTPLGEFMNAARCDDKSLISDYLKEKICEVNAKDHRGFSALMYASLHGNMRALKELIRKGAYVNIKCGPIGVTPLMMAASYGYINVCVVLVNAGAELDIRDLNRKTASDWARRAQKSEILELFETVRKPKEVKLTISSVKPSVKKF